MKKIINNQQQALLYYLLIVIIFSIHTIFSYFEIYNFIVLQNTKVIHTILKIGISFVVFTLTTAYSIIKIIKQNQKPLISLIKGLSAVKRNGTYGDQFNFPSDNNILQSALKNKLHETFIELNNFDTLKADKIARDNNVLRNILNDISEGIVVLDKDKMVLNINSQAERFLKLTSGESREKNITRIIKNSNLENLINSAIKNESNTVDISIEIAKDEIILVDALTYLNKYKNTAGVVLVIKESKKIETVFNNEEKEKGA